MKIVITHAYSSTNSGDGLLVDEARRIALEAFNGATIDLVALDPASFPGPDFSTISHPLSGVSATPRASELLLRAAIAALSGSTVHPQVRDLLSDADLVLAVGGGYLRGSSTAEALKMFLVHFPQLPRRSSDASVVYLPQSIGPLRGITGKLIRARLANATVIYSRDDRTVSELATLQNVRRTPDLALLGIPPMLKSTGIDDRRGTRRVAVVARRLAGGRRSDFYREQIAKLREELDAEYLVQANARGNNDREFYRSLGYRGGLDMLSDVVASDNPPSAVVSVRLHGAIQAIRNGVASVHLSYERKGWGAYEDLGIAPYVHNAFSFDRALVRQQVEDLKTDPTSYWAAVNSSLSRLKGAREDLVADLRRAGEGRKVRT